MAALPLRRLMTLGIALAGAGAFHALGLPLPFLFGPMLICLGAALAGAPLTGMGVMAKLARTILGVAVGASITPAMVGQIPQMIGSVGLVPIYVVMIGAVGYPFFRRQGLDPATAWFAAMPGGLQDMVTFGQEAGGDGRALALIHATRVLVIVTLAPIILAWLYGASLTGAIGEPVTALPPFELGLMVLAALIGWKGAERIGLFGATILGPMIATAGLSLLGFIHSRPPAEAILAAQVFIGIGIGVQYVGITLAELRKFAVSGTVFVFVLALAAALFTELVTLTGLARPVEAFLAFVPGGQAEVAVLALATGADLGFVVVHHLVRIVTVLMGAPLVCRAVIRHGPPR
jgi:hypothetical protein